MKDEIRQDSPWLVVRYMTGCFLMTWSSGVSLDVELWSFFHVPMFAANLSDLCSPCLRFLGVQLRLGCGYASRNVRWTLQHLSIQLRMS